MSCLYLSSKLRVMRFHMLRVNPVTPAPSEDLLIFPSSHDLSGCPSVLKPCVRGPWRHTHTHTLACSANRHCVVIKEICVLSGWTGRAMSTCSGTVMTSGGRHPGGLGCCFTMYFLLQPAGGTIDWVMVLSSVLHWADTNEELCIKKNSYKVSMAGLIQVKTCIIKTLKILEMHLSYDDAKHNIIVYFTVAERAQRAATSENTCK